MDPVPGRTAWLLVVMVSVSLAGCMDTDPATDVGGTGPGPTVGGDDLVAISYNVTAARCDSTALHLRGSADEARRLLPDGFEPSTRAGGMPFVVVTQTCTSSDTAISPHRTAELFVLVERPVVAARVSNHVNETMSWVPNRGWCEAELEDRYYVAGYSDARFWAERYRQAGVPALEAAAWQSIERVDVAASRAVALVQGGAEAGQDEPFSFDAVGHEEDAGVRDCQRTWFQSDHGLFLIDELRHGAPGGPAARVYAGVATCDAEPGTPFAAVLTGARCAHADLRMVSDLTRSGYAFWFHDVFVAA